MENLVANDPPWSGHSWFYAWNNPVGQNQSVAERSLIFGMKVMYYDSSGQLQAEKDLGIHYAKLNELLAMSDFLAVHTNLTRE
jgi:phosphoglycerate dehydrogenase-like enzyme